MPYEFTEFEYEPEAHASSSRGGRPPGKWTTAGVLDPLVPPGKPRDPASALSISLLARLFAALLLVSMGILTLLALFHSR